MSAAEIYSARPIKRRRTKAEIEPLWEAMTEELAEHHPQSVRHVYYRMVVRDLVAKTDTGHNTVQIQLVKMRRAGVVPYSWVTDGTRWVWRVKTYGSPAEAVAEVARLYRRSIWEQTPVLSRMLVRIGQHRECNCRYHGGIRCAALPGEGLQQHWVPIPECPRSGRSRSR